MNAINAASCCGELAAAAVRLMDCTLMLHTGHKGTSCDDLRSGQMDAAEPAVAFILFAAVACLMLGSLHDTTLADVYEMTLSTPEYARALLDRSTHAGRRRPRVPSTPVTARVSGFLRGRSQASPDRPQRVGIRDAGRKPGENCLRVDESPETISVQPSHGCCAATIRPRKWLASTGHVRGRQAASLVGKAALSQRLLRTRRAAAFCYHRPQPDPKPMPIEKPGA
jgi:hypothetical protein